ncbi:Non-lysosomal glucosylceramidase [Pelomyxa schiedti]|nr:Non-lysosomal glucosylceramidase [Pelomyxa schiedti]
MVVSAGPAISSLVTLVVCWGVAEVLGGQRITLSLGNGSYAVAIDGTTWLDGGPVGVRHNSKWYTTMDGTLVLCEQEKSVTGSDSLGQYTATQWNYCQASDATTIMEVVFKTYTSIPVITFEQSFPKDLVSTSTYSSSSVSTCFPSFNVALEGINFITYTGEFAEPLLGTWGDSSYPGGLTGGVPLCLYDSALKSIVISPLTNFMTGIQEESSYFDALSCGIQGRIDSIPAGFSHTTIISFDTSVTQAFYDWGSRLLQYSGKGRNDNFDLMAKILGYSTNNGAYYYYQTETLKTYEQTILDIYAEQSSLMGPKFYQFDSWWYFTGYYGGVKLWEPRKEVFPDGMEYIHESLNYSPLMLQSSYFSPDTDYASNFSFISERKCSIPLNQDVYDYMFGKALSWGMLMYEQDDLAYTFSAMDATQTSLTVARDWLINMGNAAKKLSLPVQYSSAYPNHLLESTEIPSVITARTSADYQPGNKQWQVFFGNLLVWSLGLVPVKDTFWTSSQELGCSYTLCDEPNTELHALVSALSSGSIMTGDKLDHTSADILRKTCINDAVLLKPDIPAIPIDIVFDQFSTTPVTAQLAHTYAVISGMTWSYVFAAELPWAIQLYPSSLELAGVNLVAVDYFDAPTSPITMNDTLPLHIASIPTVAAHTQVPFKYYVIAPVLQSGWTLFGDMTKYLCVAHPRISSIANTATSVTVTLSGTEGEVITVSAIPPSSSSFVTGTCTIPAGTTECTVTCSCSSTCVCA